MSHFEPAGAAALLEDEIREALVGTAGTAAGACALPTYSVHPSVPLTIHQPHIAFLSRGSAKALSCWLAWQLPLRGTQMPVCCPHVYRHACLHALRPSIQLHWGCSPCVAHTATHMHVVKLYQAILSCESDMGTKWSKYMFASNMPH